MATVQVGVAARAFNHDPHCGDQCAYWQTGAKTTLCIVDGLGHGRHAEDAAKAAVRYVSSHLSTPLMDLFAGCDKALRTTRGVAMGIVVIDETAGTLTYAGINNTRAMIAGPRPARFSSNYGIVGGRYKKLVPETVAVTPGDVVVLFSDGIPETIDLTRYDVMRAELSPLARDILQDWALGTDDAAVFVARYLGPEARE